MRIALGSDHAGLPLKQELVRFIEGLGHTVEDFGTHDTQSVDYPDYARQVAEATARGDFDRGILVCATGIGMCIAANKVHGVRAALCHEPFSARRSREHNDANVLCLGGLIIGVEMARQVVLAFLEGSFEGGRHARRVGKIGALESAESTKSGSEAAGTCAR